MQASRHFVLRTVMLAVVMTAGSAQAADGDLHCTLTFQTRTWSIIYKSATGLGTIHCSNGQSLRVRLSAKGGGYAAVQAHAGAVNSVQAQVMTKGEVSLALSGKGHGWSLGVDFSELKIER